MPAEKQIASVSPCRAVVLVLDGVGCGELPDAAEYGDAGSNTLANTARAVGGMNLPALQKMGLGNILDIQGVPPEGKPLAAHGKLAEISPAKDSTVGHWEMMCCPVEHPLPTYPHGFPPQIVAELTAKTGYNYIGNIVASGTEIIDRLGEQHLSTGALILYTSADSVLQIAAHEELVLVPELYRICEIARAVMTGEHAVGRIIARPFIGTPGSFKRTPRRHDISIKPPHDSLLDILTNYNIPVHAVGKIYDLFGGRGISQTYPTKNNLEGIDKTIELIKTIPSGFIYTNLVDFDMQWGHRNDPKAFYAGLQEFDRFLPEIIDNLRQGDLLILTADHGVDPTTPSTDHSREYVPVLAYIKGGCKGVDLGTRESFADVGATAGEFLGVEMKTGESFVEEIKNTEY